MIVSNYSRAPLYAQLYPILSIKALEYGYSLGIHGTMQRDLDLIAIPWEETVKSHIELLQAFESVTGGKCAPRTSKNGMVIGPYEPVYKPHGRLSYIIALSKQGALGPYIDISVVPTQQNG